MKSIFIARSIWAAIIVAGLLAMTASAQQTGFDDRGFKALERGEYLRGLDLLQVAIGPSLRNGGGPLSTWRQMLPAITTLPDMSYANQGKGEVAPAVQQQLQAAKLRSAVDEIVKRARNTRIVILNEAHNSPRDRAFALQVARALRPLGYNFLAVETFANFAKENGPADPMAAMARDGYPRLAQGFYLKEPVFGDFIRQSLALGYRPIAYEHVAPGPSGIAAREQGQTDNLVASIFRDQPNARVFIYVGYDHATERLMENGNEWMARRLQKATGIDPLTIDQTGISEYSDDPGSRAMHALVANRVVQSPAILMSGDAPLVVGRYAGAIDLQVVHPRTQIRQGRPTWLASMGRHPVAIPPRLLPRTGRRLVQAFLASEAGDAIPVDQILVYANKPAPVLMLPSRPVRYAFQDSACSGQPNADAGECAEVKAAMRIDQERKARQPVMAQARLQSDRRDFAGAARTYSKALAASPNDMDLLVGRGNAYARSGDEVRAEQDYMRVRAATKTGGDLNELCWEKATGGFALKSALADCNAALGKEPDNAEFIDSRAFVLLRLGRYDEAIADYDRALASKLVPHTSRFGRAVARAKKGDKAGSDADLAAALKENDTIRAEFGRYGITL